MPTIQAFFAKYRWTDIVFYIYLPSSLKSETKSKQGCGVRPRMTSTGKVPSNWQSFLRDSDNKTDLQLLG